jgi:hypothetical protein
MKNFIYNIVEGFKNLYYYLPTVWKDRDFDWYYTQEILLKKLKKQYKHFSSEEHEDYIKHIQALRICIAILERESNNYYCNYFYDRVENDEGNDEKYIQECLMMEERDMKWFGNILGKYFHNWWT